MLLLISFYLFPTIFSCIPTESPEDRPIICTTTTAVPPTCPAGWTQYLTNCYIFEATPAFTSAAVTNCMALGGHLVSVMDANENTFISNLAGNAMIYIGVARVGTMNTNDNFANLDGTTFSFSNWNTGQPNNGGAGVAGTEYCITMGPTGLWEDITCTVTMYPYVCKQPLV